MSDLIAIHREPFSTAPHVYHVQAGDTLLDMVRRVHSLPDGWPRHDGDAICIDGHEVPRALWGITRAKGGRVSEITFHAPPMGGGGGSGKQIAGIVASIGLIALSGGIASGAVFPALGGSTVAGQASLLSRLVGAAVLIGGSLALQALTPTPSVPRRAQRADNSRRELGSAAIQGNILEPNAPLPRVAGTRKVFPPFATEPLVFFEGEDEVVEALVALAGPHKLEDIRVGDALATDTQDVAIETHEGWPGKPPLKLLSRYGRTIPDGTTIRGHTVEQEDHTQLKSFTGNIIDATPRAKTVSTRDGQDAFWLGLQFPQGLSRTGSQTELNDLMRVAFRIRMRPRGTVTWINFPELHFMDAVLGPRRATIKFAWRDAQVDTSAAATRGWVEGRIFSQGQDIDPTGDPWTAGNPETVGNYFIKSGADDNFISATNAGTSKVKNLILGTDEAEFQLDRAVFPPGIYEVEIKRGYAFRDAEYSSSGYTINGSVRDTFAFEGVTTARIHQTKKNLIDELLLVRSNAVWDDDPVRLGDVALIAVRGRNVSMDRISVLASGYVRDLDATLTDWTEWSTTDNPAPHIRDVFSGLLNATPLPPALADDQSLRDWRAAGWTVNAVLEGLSVAEAANVIAGAGFAQPFQSDKFGVIEDKDRSAETPVQIFTPQNSGGFSWARGFPKLPDGFRATFVDADQDYNARQIIHPVGAARTEQVTIEGLVHESDVRARLQFDLDVAKYRASFFSWDAAAEAIKVRRGSLVGVASDTLSTRSFTGRVVDFNLDASGNVTKIQLDNSPSFDSVPDMLAATDLLDVEDMLLVGEIVGIAVRRKGEIVSVHPVSASVVGPDWVDLNTPAALPGLDYGDIVAVGTIGSEFRRLIVIDVRPKTLTDWSITAVAEAPQLWQ